MSEEVSHEVEGSVLQAEVQAKLKEYEAMREREYESAIARLEDVSIEPEQHAAYAATLPRILALPIENVAWPCEDPRFRLHHAIERGRQLIARRPDIDALRTERQPHDCVPESVYTIEQTALAALHAFKVLRANPEPEGTFAKLFAQAARRRGMLEALAAMVLHCEWIGPQDLRHYDGGVTVEAIACDLSLLAGVLQKVPLELRLPKLDTRLELMEATMLAQSLMQHAARTNTLAELWEPWLLYARALTLVDDASLQAAFVLAELHHADRDSDQEFKWKPQCLFCDSNIERQRHHRHNESPKAAQRRAQFISSTMTAALRRPIVNN